VTPAAGCGGEHSEHPLADNIFDVTGKVDFTVDQTSFLLGPGECVAARVDRPTCFEVLGVDPAEYLMNVDGASR
jgi:hypothetical protein